MVIIGAINGMVSVKRVALQGKGPGTPEGHAVCLLVQLQPAEGSRDQPPLGRDQDGQRFELLLDSPATENLETALRVERREIERERKKADSAAQV